MKDYIYNQIFLKIQEFNFKELEEEEEKDKLVILKLFFQKMKFF